MREKSVCERDSVFGRVCERKRESGAPRPEGSVQPCPERERERVCVCERECVRERVRVCERRVSVRDIVCVRGCVRAKGNREHLILRAVSGRDQRHFKVLPSKPPSQDPTTRQVLQGYLAHKKMSPLRTLQ